MNQHKTDDQFIKVIVDPAGCTSRILKHLESMSEGPASRGKFALALGATETSDVPGISAAGASPEQCRYTPASDAEGLLFGKSLSTDMIPVSPAGIVSPVVITRPMLKELGCEIDIIDCGVFVSPRVPHSRIGTRPALCVSTGHAMDIHSTEKLYLEGVDYGTKNSRNLDYLLLAECVPGGTTSAEAVLTALQYNVEGLVSTSYPVPDRKLRSKLVCSGVAAFKSAPAVHRSLALSALAAVGDPMQPFVLGAALAASKHTKVILCGGAQMLAIWSLMLTLTLEQEPAMNPAAFNLDNVLIATTKWIAFDPRANSGKLAQLLQAPFIAAMPDFNKSAHAVLRAYENGHVKEGVGAGAGMAMAHIISGIQASEIMHLIDDGYQESKEFQSNGSTSVVSLVTANTQRDA